MIPVITQNTYRHIINELQAAAVQILKNSHVDILVVSNPLNFYPTLIITNYIRLPPPLPLPDPSLFSPLLNDLKHINPPRFSPFQTYSTKDAVYRMRNLYLYLNNLFNGEQIIRTSAFLVRCFLVELCIYFF